MTFIFKAKSVLLLFIYCLTFGSLYAKSDKFRCIWRDNPATTMTIAWNQVSGSNPIVHYDVINNGSQVHQYAFKQKPNKVVMAKGMNNHFVRLTGLEPNTAYYFIIKDSQEISRTLWFKTAPDNPYERLSIIAGGDSRNHRNARRNANKIVSKLRPHCIVFGGDMTGLDRSRQWKNWFDDWQHTIGDDGRIIPLIAARGNHEFSNKSLVDLFDVPHKNVYYALTLGGNLLRVYTLNTIIATGGEQKKWLEKDLKQQDQTIWKMAQYHHPMRPHTAKKSEGQRTYRNWAKLFYENNVRLVVECDAHVVKTTWPVRPSYDKGHDMGFIRDDKNGIVFVGEGCWGAPIRAANDDKKWTRNSGSFNQVKWVWVGYDDIQIRTVKTDNADVVGTVDDGNVFQKPANLNVWKPSNGSVVTVRKREKLVISKPKSPKKATNKKPTKTPAKPIKKVKKSSEKKAKTKPKNIKRALANLDLMVHSFKAIKKKDRVVMNWETSNEPVGVVCEIQRSLNGFDFYTISKLSLLGRSDKVQSYQMTDEKSTTLNAPFVFYRLRHVHNNGSFSLTNKEIIRLKGWESYEKLPIDKATGNVFPAFNLKKDTNVEINLYNEKGTVLSSQVYMKQLSGDQLKSVSVGSLPKGIYLLDINKGDGEHQYWRIIKE